jgi:hypothetical protein
MSRSACGWWLAAPGVSGGRKPIPVQYTTTGQGSRGWASMQEAVPGGDDATIDAAGPPPQCAPARDSRLSCYGAQGLQNPRDREHAKPGSISIAWHAGLV